MAAISESKILASEDVTEKCQSSEGAVEETEIPKENTKRPPNRKRKRRKRKSHQSGSDDETDSKPKGAAVQGVNKSGRFWKSEKKRFRTVIKSRGLVNTTLEKRLALRADLKHAKELTRATVDKRQADKEAKKERRRDNMRRAAENQKKAEIIQVIKNSAKIKKMKKKQLRYIEKRDTTKIK